MQLILGITHNLPIYNATISVGILFQSIRAKIHVLNTKLEQKIL